MKIDVTRLEELMYTATNTKPPGGLKDASMEILNAMANPTSPFSAMLKVALKNVTLASGVKPSVQIVSDVGRVSANGFILGLLIGRMEAETNDELQLEKIREIVGRDAPKHGGLPIVNQIREVVFPTDGSNEPMPPRREIHRRRRF